MKFRFCGDLDCPDWVLAEINTLSKMSSIRLKVLAAQIVSYALIGELNYEKVLKLASDNSDGISDIKGAIAAVNFIISNAAKYDLEDNDLSQEIQQLGLPKENSDTIIKQYRDNKDNLRLKLESDSYRIAKYSGLDWRIDQLMADSNSTEANRATNQKLIHFNIKVDSPQSQQSEKNLLNINNLHEFAFQLNAEQLDSLIVELTQAQQYMDNMDS